MKQFIITEEERNRILNLHEERTSRHYLMEQTTGVTQSTGTTQTSGSTPTLVSGPYGNPDRKQYVYNVNGKFFIYYTTPANSTPVPEKGNPFTNNGQGFATEGQATAKIKQMTPNQEELDRQQDINRSSYSDTEVNEELIEGYENSLYSDIMELIHDSNSSHEETIDVLNSIVDEMSSSRRMRRNVERRFRDEMNEEGEPYAPGMKPTPTGPQGKSPGLNAPKIKEFKGIQDPEWRAICSDLQKLGFKQTGLYTFDDGTTEGWEKGDVTVRYVNDKYKKSYVNIEGPIKWEQMPKDYKTNRCYAGVPSKSERLGYNDRTDEGDKFHHGELFGNILKSCKKEILDLATKSLTNKY